MPKSLESGRTCDPLKYLPPELFDQIVLNLELRDIVKLRQVCQSWNSHISSGVFYRDIDMGPAVIYNGWPWFKIYQVKSSEDGTVDTDLMKGFIKHAGGYLRSLSLNGVDKSQWNSMIEVMFTSLRHYVEKDSSYEPALRELLHVNAECFNIYTAFDNVYFKILRGLRVLQISEVSMISVMNMITELNSFPELKELDIYCKPKYVWIDESEQLKITSRLREAANLILSSKFGIQYQTNLQHLKIGGLPGHFGSNFGKTDQTECYDNFITDFKYIEVVISVFPSIRCLILADICAYRLGTSSPDPPIEDVLDLRISNSKIVEFQIYQSPLRMPILPAEVEVLIVSGAARSNFLPRNVNIDADGKLLYADKVPISVNPDEYRNVQHLDFTRCRFGSARLIDILSRYGQSLQRLRLDQNLFTDRDQSSVKYYGNPDEFDFTRSHYACLQYGGHVPEDVTVMDIIATLCPNLTHLSLRGNTAMINRNSLKAIGKFKKLEFLDLSDCYTVFHDGLELMLWGDLKGPRIPMAVEVGEESGSRVSAFQSRFGFQTIRLSKPTKLEVKKALVSKDSVLLPSLRILRLNNCWKVETIAKDIIESKNIMVEAAHIVTNFGVQ
ncbi:hypothetical protein V1512DRAFT_256589 [Lipomyces arxii]|uniref:uncharacterized protein n=1 Tax=Lipomyces arxii TaxID=56418 RepID=UPI0034CEC323